MAIGSKFDAVVAAAQSGAEWAFAVLYRDINPGLVRYLWSQDPGGSEDVAGEVWLAVARQIREFRGDERALRCWMFTIARRRLIQHWREQGRRPCSPEDPSFFQTLLSLDDPEGSTVSEMSAHEAIAEIRALLTPDQADVVLLRVLGGLEVEQVASILGKRNGTVRVLQHKALRNLAASFAVKALTH